MHTNGSTAMSEMGALSIKLARRSSSEDISCDLDAMDQGMVSDSSSSSATASPLSRAVSKVSGLMTSSINSSSQGSNMTSRASSMPDSAALQDVTATAEESQQQQQDASQICFDFTKGMCTRGDKCKYSHDIATIVHFNSKEKGICFDYLRNQCHRGLLCRFSHDLSNIAQQCQVYNGSAASAPANKSRSGSICYDFVKGVCTRGSECRYSHDLTLIARMARGSSGGDTDQGQQADVCFDFLRGRCTRGDTCKYSHNPAALHTPAAPLNPFGMDPNLMATWPLVNPQAAAAAAATAAAAAAFAATGGVGPAAAGLNPFTAAAAGFGGFNPFARPGMMGLGADPFAAAAAAASLAATSPGCPVGLLGGGVSPFGPAAGLGMMTPASMTRHGSQERSTSGSTPTQMTDALHATASSGDPLSLFMAMQHQQQSMAAAAAAASAAASAACPASAASLGIGAAAAGPLQMMPNTADMHRRLPRGPARVEHSTSTQGGRRLSLNMPNDSSAIGSGAGLPPPGSLLPPAHTPRRFSDLGVVAPAAVGGTSMPSVAPNQHKAATMAASSFGRVSSAGYNTISSRVSCDGSFGTVKKAAAEGANGARAGSAGLPPLAGQHPHASGAGQLDRAHSAPAPSHLQQQHKPARSGGSRESRVSGKTPHSVSHSMFNPLAAGLGHLSIRGCDANGTTDFAAHSGGMSSRASSGAVSDAMVVGIAAAAPAGASPHWHPAAGMSAGGRFSTHDGVAGASPAGNGEWESSPDAVVGSGDELDKAEPYGDLLPRLQAIWSK